MRERMSPSLVISVIALIVALGGVSYAAIKIPKNSVGTKQLKKNAVTVKKLKKNSVNSAKVKDRTLLRKDFKPGQLPGEAWYAQRDSDPPLLPLTGEFQPVVTSQELPAGSYVLNARANVVGGGGPNATVICSMEGDAAQNFTVETGQTVALAMSATLVQDEPGPVSLDCQKSTGSPSIAQAHIIATRVTRVNGG